MSRCLSSDQSAQFIQVPGAYHQCSTRKIQLAPGIAITAQGRLWATWYAGKMPAEDEHNFVVLSSSADGGKTWAEVLIIDPDKEGPVRAFDPALWISPNGNLFFFWSQLTVSDGEKRDASKAGLWYLEIINPEKSKPRYGAPKRAAEGIMACKPMCLSSGEWVLPVSTWPANSNSAGMVVSTDQGETWHVRGACHVPKEDRDFDEHIIIERGDASLSMLIRTKYGLAQSFSSDRGVSWGQVRPMQGRHVDSRAFIRRLHSGRILLIKHGETMDGIDDQLDYSNPHWVGRSHLSAWVSDDEGETWNGGLILDERPGVSYPDGMQSEDGTIYIIYDHERIIHQDILMARFSEADVLAASLVSEQSELRIPVS